MGAGPTKFRRAFSSKCAIPNSGYSLTNTESRLISTPGRQSGERAGTFEFAGNPSAVARHEPGLRGAWWGRRRGWPTPPGRAAGPWSRPGVASAPLHRGGGAGEHLHQVERQGPGQSTGGGPWRRPTGAGDPGPGPRHQPAGEASMDSRTGPGAGAAPPWWRRSGGPCAWSRCSTAQAAPGGPWCRPPGSGGPRPGPRRRAALGPARGLGRG